MTSVAFVAVEQEVGAAVKVVAEVLRYRLALVNDRNARRRLCELLLWARFVFLKLLFLQEVSFKMMMHSLELQQH